MSYPSYSNCALELKPESTGSNAGSVPFSVLEHVAEYERLFPGYMRIFEFAGIHPVNSSEIENPYLPSMAPQSFRNIGDHSIAAAECARKIAKALIRRGALRNGLARLVTGRALLHDITKSFEVMFAQAVKAGVDGSELTPPAAVLRKKLIRAGVPWNYIQDVLGAGTETGHQNCRKFLCFNEKMELSIVPDRILDKIVRLADDMTYTSIPRHDSEAATLYMPASKRLTSACSVEKYPFAIKGGLFVDEEGNIENSPDIRRLGEGKFPIANYLNVQIFIANKIAEEFKSYLDPDSSDSAEAVILRVLAEG